MSDVAIQVHGIGKKYRKGVEEGGQLFEWLSHRDGEEVFWALRNISFEVRQGEMFGIIGSNGAGKSTLLKILSRVTRPNEGRAEVYGQVGSLLEVGTGFNPELTGRENIYLNGALIGLRKQDIVSKFDEIVEFSGIEDFLDTPIKRYSSGMKVRLGFAVAVHLEQEILLVDEVLSVGDATFKEKSLAKMDEVTGSGRTVVFVGHDLSVISTACHRALWLERGVVKELGKAPEVAHHYLESISPLKQIEEGFISLSDRSDHETDQALVLTHLRLLDESDTQIPYFRTRDKVKIALGYQAHGQTPKKDVVVSLTILNRRQQPIAVCQYTCAEGSFGHLPSSGEFVCTVEKLPLMPGRYKLSTMCKVGSEMTQQKCDAGEFTVIDGNYAIDGMPALTAGGDVLFDHCWFLRESGLPHQTG
jgi:lipopolysaccharide transport system ATP-binding protein